MGHQHRAFHRANPSRYEDRWGAEDSRITKLDDDYLVAYTGFSPGGPLGCLVSTRVMARSDEWVFGPEAPYEQTGDVPGVIFPTGWVTDGNDSVRMYYGAADTAVVGCHCLSRRARSLRLHPLCLR